MKSYRTEKGRERSDDVFLYCSTHTASPVVYSLEDLAERSLADLALSGENHLRVEALKQTGRGCAYQRAGILQ